MNKCASAVMQDCGDIIFAIGASDEYSFVFKKEANLFQRRASKIITSIVSSFTGRFMFHWNEYFPAQPLLMPPSFDGRVVCYPSDENVRDYISWRQVDFHINFQYNVCFWALVQRGNLAPSEAQAKLKGSNAEFKNELLFSQFGINYNNLPAIYRKGSILIWDHTVVSRNGAEGVHGDSDVKQVGNEIKNEEGSHELKCDVKLIEMQDNDSSSSSESRVKSQSKSLSRPYNSICIKKQLIVVHDDVIQNHFWREKYPGIIPFVSASERLKALKLAQAQNLKNDSKNKNKVAVASPISCNDTGSNYGNSKRDGEHVV
jgi:tRNA(His) guanylyltransferase